ncbi:hypothetical protein BDV95DRAFT_176148 [Massariosphaeria phaeospora]|uniref:Uncharacterized protein n=1 Tax=Massariosphaeria phaeospora TaxID=100035 RepID=A0A7C8I0X1_9PLEO|nr:hypothetical protein BDV95DRAFT_176148 [Massariosphaeria phaeospora]
MPHRMGYNSSLMLRHCVACVHSSRHFFGRGASLHGTRITEAWIGNGCGYSLDTESEQVLDTANPRTLDGATVTVMAFWHDIKMRQVANAIKISLHLRRSSSAILYPFSTSMLQPPCALPNPKVWLNQTQSHTDPIPQPCPTPINSLSPSLSQLLSLPPQHRNIKKQNMNQDKDVSCLWALEQRVKL